MYPSLSGIDAVETHRQELLAEAALRHRFIYGAQPGKTRIGTAAQAKGTTEMWSLVNASYGIAMGQRPTDVAHPRQNQESRSGHSIQHSSFPMSTPWGRCVQCIQRALGTMTARMAKRRALAGVNT